MPYKPTDDELDKVLDATCDSTNRVRQVLIVMSTASIVVFVAAWNSLDISWMRWRANTFSAAELWTSYHEDEKEKKRWDALGAKVDSGKASDAEQEQFKKWKKAFDTGEAYSRRLLLPYAQLKETAKKSRDAVADSAATIRIPFFGVAIDANDTALLGALPSTSS